MSSTKRCFLHAVAVVLFIVAGGCGTMPNGKGWGQDATFTPGWNRIGQAALSAAKTPETWAPAVAAAAFRIEGDYDRRVARRIATKAQVFGSMDKASQRSDNLQNFATGLWAASALASPGGNTVRDWTANKAKLFGVQAGSAIFVRGAVGYVKESTDRTSPNRHDGDGFPSGHVTCSAYFAALASRNIETMDWPRGLTNAAQIGLGTVSVAEAWARVEAYQHYPSDVLGSLALGHFFGAFVSDAFLGADNPRKIVLLFEPGSAGRRLIVRLDF